MGGNEWDAQAYDTRFGFVSRYGDDLLDLMGPVRGTRVIDLGCGTGRHAADLAGRGADVVGVDADASMIERARDQHPHVRFVHLDAADLSLTALDEPDRFDSCVSNAALHWMSDQERVLSNVHDVLAPGGRFVAEMGGAGNIAALDRALRAGLSDIGMADAPVVTNYFPTAGQQASLLERCAFRVELVAWFPRPTPLASGSTAADWTRHFRADTWRTVPEQHHDALRDAINAHAGQLHTSEGWIADYCRLRFVAIAT